MNAPQNFLDQFRPQNDVSRQSSDQVGTSNETSPDFLTQFRPDSEKKRISKSRYSDEEWQAMSDEEKLQAAEEIAPGMELRELGGIAKGALSGATLGLSEYIPGFKPTEEEQLSGAGKFAGSILPISRLYNWIGKPLVNLASKSPYASKALQSLASLTGWGLTGATYKGVEDTIQGKPPSAENILQHGAEWAALDAALQTIGATGRFAKWVIDKAKGEKKAGWEVINDLLTNMKNEGIDISQTDRVTAKVLSELEKPLPKATKEATEIKLSKEPEPTKTEKIGKEVLEKPETQPKLDIAYKKLQPIEYKTVTENAEALAEPSKPRDVQVDNTVEKLAKERTESLVEDVGQTTETYKEFGENVKEGIETGFKQAEKLYEPLYKEVEQKAKNITYKPKNTIQLANDILENINSLKTKPEGYKKVISTLEDALSDMGYVTVPMGNRLILETKGGLKPFSTVVEVPLSKTMELARRLNKIADYDIVGPSIKKQINRIASELKKDIRSTLKSADENAYNKFMEAESKYAETAKKYGNDAIHEIRGQQKPEKIASSILEPSTLEKLKNVSSPEQYNRIQRQILDHLKEMSYDKAFKQYQQLNPFLDKKASDAAKSIIAGKAPKGKPSMPDAIKSGIINELNHSFAKGVRPKKVLDLWKTSRGQKLIKDALKDSPNKKEILDYLNDQSLYDFATTVVDKTGKINFKELSEFLKDPAFVANLEMAGGKEAVKFFRELKIKSDILNFNADKLTKMPNVILSPKKGTYKYGEDKLIKAAEKAKKPTTEVEKFKEVHPKKREETPSFNKGKQRLKQAARNKEKLKFKLQDLADKFGFTPTIKGALAALGILKFTGPTIGIATAKILYKLATRSSSRKSIDRLIAASQEASKTNNALPFIAAMHELEDEFND